MTSAHDKNPLAGPTDDVDSPEPAEPTAPPKSTKNDDGSEWIPKPVPTEGDGPLP